MSNTLLQGLNRFGAMAPRMIPSINSMAARALSAGQYSDTSYRVFTTSHRVPFTASEYAVPRAAVLAGLRSWLDSHDRNVSFPTDSPELYPRFDDFRRVRDRVDPDRVFGNAYLDRVLGS